MIARWRLQLLSELAVGTAFRQKVVAEDQNVDRLRSVMRGAR